MERPCISKCTYSEAAIGTSCTNALPEQSALNVIFLTWAFAAEGLYKVIVAPEIRLGAL